MLVTKSVKCLLTIFAEDEARRALAHGQDVLKDVCLLKPVHSLTFRQNCLKPLRAFSTKKMRLAYLNSSNLFTQKFVQISLIIRKWFEKAVISAWSRVWINCSTFIIHGVGYLRGRRFVHGHARTIMVTMKEVRLQLSILDCLVIRRLINSVFAWLMLIWSLSILIEIPPLHIRASRVAFIWVLSLSGYLKT